jgi:hydrogenase nickel incorporation protein HypB
MRIDVKKNILAGNAELAAANRDILSRHGVSMVNLMASPGAGKTSIITRAIEGAGSDLAIAVIEGDIASEIDSLAIEALGITALQINTDGGCHLTAEMVSSALEHLDLDSLDLIIIENVGNLVCPAEFDLGETTKVMIASVTEGHDKPHKYPLIFKEVDTVLVNKVDLLPYCDFDMGQFQETVWGLNPGATIIETSCTEGLGLEEWCSWLGKKAAPVK